MDSQKSFNKTKRSSRSYFHKDRENRDLTVDEPNIINENTNGKGNMQSELQIISNFHAIRKSSIETLHLASKSIEVNSVEEQKIKEELKGLKEKINNELDSFKESFQEQMVQLHR